MDDLIGKTIVAIRPMTAEELDQEGWEPSRFQVPIALELSNGIILYASTDEEGNGPGQLFGAVPDGGGFIVTVRKPEGATP